MKILVAALFKNSLGGGSGSFMECVYNTLKYGNTQYTEIIDLNDMNNDSIIIDYEQFDFIICSHQSILKLLRTKKLNAKIMCISQGWIPEEERFIPGADVYVSISEEVRKYNLKKQNIDSIVIRQPIITRRVSFNPIKKDITMLRGLYIKNGASNDSNILRETGSYSGFDIRESEKKYDIFQQIQWSDFVIGLGRSALEGMSYGKPAIVADTRWYHDYPCGDGLLTSDVIHKSRECNYSGRAFNELLTKEWLTLQLNDLKEDYLEHSKFSHKYIEENHDADMIVAQYIDILKSI